MKQTTLIVAITFLIGAGFALRASNASYANTQANQLANAAANNDTTTKLNTLKQYVASHSGSTITVVLTGAYNTAVQQVQTEASAMATPSSSLYAAAQAACAGHAMPSRRFKRHAINSTSKHTVHRLPQPWIWHNQNYLTIHIILSLRFLPLI